jgi:hypothetical protein
MTRDELAALVAALGDLVQVIRDADPADKAGLYAQPGLTLTYRPQKRLVEATVKPSLHMCKGLCPRGSRQLRTYPPSRVDWSSDGSGDGGGQMPGSGGRRSDAWRC